MKLIRLAFAVLALGCAFGVRAQSSASTVGRTGAFTFATLPTGTGPGGGAGPGDMAYTSDQGPVWFNGNIWVTEKANQSYLGFVATNGKVSDNGSNVNGYFMSRTLHIATTDINAAQLVFGNFYATGASTETGGGTTATYTASIEYPAGTFYQATFGGQVSGTAASLKYLVSDPIAVRIPSGASFFVRVYRVHAAGSFSAPFSTVATTLSNTAGDACTFGSTNAVTDKTMGGTVTATNLQIAIPPMAIIGITSKPSVILIGDSRVSGINDTPTTTSPAVGETARSFWNAKIGYSNIGIASSTAAGFSALNYPMTAQLINYATHIVSNYGVNDLYTNGSTAAATLGFQQLIASTYPGKWFFAATVAPYTTSSDGWETLGNQSQQSTADNTQRIAYNTALRAGGISGITGTIDIASAVESSLNSGLWIVNGTLHQYTADGIHENGNSNAVIVSSGVVNPALIGR
jgi:hypothetical protein